MIRQKIDRDEVEKWINSTEEMIEIITDVINGEYSIEAIRSDINEWLDEVKNSIQLDRSKEEDNQYA